MTGTERDRKQGGRLREICRFQLTAFVDISGDVDGCGVVRDGAFEVWVKLEVVWNISVLHLCLIKLWKTFI